MRDGLYRLLPGLVLAIVLTSAPLADQIEDQPEVESQYAKGKRLLRGGDFAAASAIFDELVEQHGSSPNLDLFIFNRAKADLHGAEYDKALAGFDLFTARFPNSPYAAYAQYFAGNAAYLKGSISLAVENYLAAYGITNDAPLLRLTEKSLVAAFDRADAVRISAGDFSILPADKRCVLIALLESSLIAQDQTNVFAQVSASCGDSSVMALDAHRTMTGDIEIACVLPFSGELESFGAELFNGAVVAAEFSSQESGRRIKLVKYDTHGDPIDAARITRELSQSSRTLAAIGPLTSEEASVASATLACGNLPLLSPTATKAGLTRLSSTSFQMSPNIEFQGVVMADYAIDVLGADSAAILAPTSTDHMRMAQAFIERFKERNGTVVAVEYYRTRDRDFGDYIRDLKGILLGLERDSIYYVNENGDTLDPDGLPAHLDALFMPGTATQLRQLLPQLNFYNLNAAYLGSDGWGDDLVYNLGDNVTK